MSALRKVELTASDIVGHIQDYIKELSESTDIDVCEIEAELVANSLLKPSCERCRVNWLDYMAKLESKLEEINSEIIKG